MPKLSELAYHPLRNQKKNLDDISHPLYVHSNVYLQIHQINPQAFYLIHSQAYSNAHGVPFPLPHHLPLGDWHDG